jgi:hypothetical protein
MKRMPKYVETQHAKAWIRAVEMERLWAAYAEREKRCQAENKAWHECQAKKNVDK